MQPQDPQTPPTEPQVSTLQPQALSQAGNAPVIVNTPPKKSKKGMLVAAIIIAALLIGGGAAYAFTRHKEAAKEPSKTASIDSKTTASPTPSAAVNCTFAAQLNIDNEVYAKLASLVAPDNACNEQQLKDFVQQAPTKSQQLDFLNAYGSEQKSSHDTERRTDQYAVFAQLEVYFNNFNYYPTSEQLSSDTWLGANFKGLDLAASKAPSQLKNSFVESASPTIGQYGYTPFLSDGKTPCKSVKCSKYNLYIRLEADGNIVTQSSLN